MRRRIVSLAAAGAILLPGDGVAETASVSSARTWSAVGHDTVVSSPSRGILYRLATDRAHPASADHPPRARALFGWDPEGDPVPLRDGVLAVTPYGPCLRLDFSPYDGRTESAEVLLRDGAPPCAEVAGNPGPRTVALEPAAAGAGQLPEAAYLVTRAGGGYSTSIHRIAFSEGRFRIEQVASGLDGRGLDAERVRAFGGDLLAVGEGGVRVLHPRGRGDGEVACGLPAQRGGWEFVGGPVEARRGRYWIPVRPTGTRGGGVAFLLHVTRDDGGAPNCGLARLTPPPPGTVGRASAGRSEVEWDGISIDRLPGGGLVVLWTGGSEAAVAAWSHPQRSAAPVDLDWNEVPKNGGPVRLLATDPGGAVWAWSAPTGAPGGVAPAGAAAGQPRGTGEEERLRYDMGAWRKVTLAGVERGRPPHVRVVETGDPHWWEPRREFLLIQDEHDSDGDWRGIRPELRVRRTWGVVGLPPLTAGGYPRQVEVRPTAPFFQVEGDPAGWRRNGALAWEAGLALLTVVAAVASGGARIRRRILRARARRRAEARADVLPRARGDEPGRSSAMAYPGLRLAPQERLVRLPAETRLDELLLRPRHSGEREAIALGGASGAGKTSMVHARLQALERVSLSGHAYLTAYGDCMAGLPEAIESVIPILATKLGVEFQARGAESGATTAARYQAVCERLAREGGWTVVLAFDEVGLLLADTDPAQAGLDALRRLVDALASVAAVVVVLIAPGLERSAAADGTGALAEAVGGKWSVDTVEPLTPLDVEALVVEGLRLDGLWPTDGGGVAARAIHTATGGLTRACHGVVYDLSLVLRGRRPHGGPVGEADLLKAVEEVIRRATFQDAGLAVTTPKGEGGERR